MPVFGPARRPEKTALIFCEKALSTTAGTKLGGNMLRFVRIMKFAVAVAAAVILASLSTQSQAQTGTVHLRIIKAGFIVGAGGGSGTLIYNGQRYRLSVGGVSVGTIGIATARLAGVAHNLRSPQDIAGVYQSAGAGVAIVGGPKVARLQNANGVVLELHGVQLGLEANLSLGGMTIALR
jgi:type V secretory pathway adhesin AidA